MENWVDRPIGREFNLPALSNLPKDLNWSVPLVGELPRESVYFPVTSIDKYQVSYFPIYCSSSSVYYTMHLVLLRLKGRVSEINSFLHTSNNFDSLFLVQLLRSGSRRF